MHVWVIVGVLVGKKDSRPSDRQHVFQKAAGKGVMISRSGGDLANRFLVFHQQLDDQSTQRGFGNLLSRDAEQFREHVADIEASRRDEITSAKALTLIARFDRTNLFEFKLRPVIGFREATAYFVEQPRLPFCFALQEQRGVVPNHRCHRPLRVAKRNSKVRSPVPCLAPLFIRKQHEAISRLPRLEFTKANDAMLKRKRWLIGGH